MYFVKNDNTVSITLDSTEVGFFAMYWRFLNTILVDNKLCAATIASKMMKVGELDFAHTNAAEDLEYLQKNPAGKSLLTALIGAQLIDFFNSMSELSAEIYHELNKGAPTDNRDLH